MQWPPINGLLGHSAASLRRLDLFFRKLRRDEPGAKLLVTGDLTTRGDQQEFDTANEYLSDKLHPPRGAYTGLSVPDWRNRAIPGNHDHWPGIDSPPSPPFLMFGPPELDLPGIFPGLAEPGFTVKLSGGHVVEFLRIDTDADVGFDSVDRVLARGVFISQLRTLGGKLRPPSEKQIRVLCLHHSQHYEASNRCFPTLEMDASSRVELHKFLATHRVSVLLCGHIHRPALLSTFRVAVAGGNASRSVLEARCGTTTQRDLSLDPKPEFLRFLKSQDLQWPNSLIVHKVRQGDHGSIVWESQVYVEGRHEFYLPPLELYGVSTSCSFTVWP
jgi:hypothetical protein